MAVDGTLYFAYGSNLNDEDRRRTIPFAEDAFRPVTAAMLPDHELSFGYRSTSRGGGALDVRPRRGSVVRGALFDLSPAAWDALDRKEGVRSGRAYERKPVETIQPDGSLRTATTYVVCQEARAAHVAPTSDYLSAVAAGLDAWGAPTAALHSVAAGGSGADVVDSVFVYGTLMREEARAAALGPHRVECTLAATAGGELHETGLGCPALRLGAATDPVHGEFVRVADVDGLLATLDRIEGFAGYGCEGSLYRRTLVDVCVGNRNRTAWTYVASDVLRLRGRIESGDWRAHHGRRRSFIERLVAACHGTSPDLLDRLWHDRNRWGQLTERAPETLSLAALTEALVDGRETESALARATDRCNLRPSG